MADTVTTNWDVLVRTRGDSSLKRLGETAGRVDHKFAGVGKTLASVGRVAARGLAVGVAASTVAFGFGIKEAAAYQKIQKQTGAVIKSTGAKAKVSAGHVHELADSIEGYTAFSDEAVQSAENLLLTFRDIRNETGKGNDIFDRATRAVTDLSTAMHIDATKAALQLGKALNDPERGYARLQRIGVAFTADQVRQIKALSASGDRLGAQKVILAELNKEFGGSARAAGTTFAGALERLKNKASDVLRDGLLPMLPALTHMVGWLADRLPGAVVAAQEGLRKFSDKVAPIADAVLTAFQTAAPKVKAVFEKFAPDVAAFVATVTDRFKTIGAAIIAAVQIGLDTGDWGPLGNTIGDNLYAALAAGGGIAKKIGAAFAAVDWASVGKAASAAAASFIVAFTIAFFSDFLSYLAHHPVSALEFVAAIIPIGRVAKVIEPLIRTIPWLSKILGPILRALGKGDDLVEGAFRRIFRGADRALGFVAPALRRRIASALDTAVTAIYSKADDAAKAAAGFGKRIVSGVLAPLAGIGDKLFSKGAEVVSGFVRGIVSKIPDVRGALQRLTDKLPDWKGPASKDRRLLVPSGRWLMDGLNVGIIDGAKKIRKTLQGITEGLRGKLKDLRQQRHDIATAAADAVASTFDISSFGQSVESTTAGAASIDPITGIVTRGADVTTSSTPTAASTASGIASQAQAFLAALRTMVAKKFLPAIIAATAAAGPGALSSAQALAAASPADVGSINRSYAATAAVGRAVGQIAGKASGLDKKIDATNDLLRQLVKAQNSDKVASLTIPKGGDLIVRYVNQKNKGDERRR